MTAPSPEATSVVEDVQTFYTAGFFFWTKPSQGTTVTVQLVGGGGSGMYGTTDSPGNGGGGGGALVSTVPITELDDSVGVQVGRGGIADGFNAALRNGEDTLFGPSWIAYGGYHGGLGGTGGTWWTDPTVDPDAQGGDGETGWPPGPVTGGAGGAMGTIPPTAAIDPAFTGRGGDGGHLQASGDPPPLGQDGYPGAVVVVTTTEEPAAILLAFTAAPLFLPLVSVPPAPVPPGEMFTPPCPPYEPGKPYSDWTLCCPPCPPEIPPEPPIPPDVIVPVILAGFGRRAGTFVATVMTPQAIVPLFGLGLAAGLFRATVVPTPAPPVNIQPSFGNRTGTFTVSTTIPLAPVWQPTDLVNTRTPYTRPQGAGFVTWESIVGTTEANRQQAAPNTPTLLTQALLATPALDGKVLTLPKGEFRFPSGHSQPNTVAWGFGVGYGNNCRGVAGSGAGGVQAHPQQTILRQQAASPAGAGTLIRINKIVDPYWAGMSLIGQQTLGDAAYDTGIMVATCTGHPVLEHLYLRGFSPGYANSPPGETFGISIYHSPNATIRDSESDGRDLAGNRTCASPWGWNTVVNDDLSVVHVQRCYAHAGRCSMLTFWETTNIWTEDYYSYSWSSGTGNQSGSPINHEQSGGRIRHIRPRLFNNSTRSAGPVGPSAYGHPAADTMPKANNTSSTTFGIASGLTDVGANFEMWYPQWDNSVGNSGILCMSGYDAYSLGDALVTPPKIYLRNPTNTGDYLLQKVDHPANNWANQDPLVYFAWIH